MKTFSIGFEEASFDELDRARLVAERYGTDHHELIVLRPDAVELLPKLVEAFDEPFGDSSALPTYLVSELAAGEVKVALSGEGGDELFGGYYTYVADLLAPRRRPPGAACRAAGRARCRAPTATGRLRLQSQALRPRRRACRRWSATTPGRRSSRAQLRAELLGRRRPPAGTRSTSTASATPRPPAPSRWRGCRTSTSASTWSTTCWSRPTARAWPTRWSCGSRSSTPRSPSSPSALPTPHQGARLREEAAAAPGAGAAAAAGDHPRPQAGLLDPGRRLAARPAASRSPARCSRRTRSSARAASTRRRSPPLLDRHCAGQEDLSRQIWGLMAFTLWFDRYAH